MRIKLLAVAATAALTTMATLLTGSPAQANHSWGGYHWARTSNPFTIALGDNVTSAWDYYLSVASSDWSQSTVLDTTVTAGSVNPKTCKATLGRVQVCNAAYGQRGWLGIASINITGGSHITQGTVKLNDSYFALAQYNTPAYRAFVTCQEVGHTLGLDHQDENFTNPNLGTCMDYTNAPSTNQHPNKHDYDQLVAIYSHLDSTSTVGSSAATTGKGQVGNDESSWGRQVEGSRAWGHSTFVRDFGGGNKVITFVTWA
ncbi:MAG: hypothetical protein ABJA93_01570 [Sporichthyaceae bacterium]